ncbi:MAG TPA: HNH endonuclease [Ktedonobacteraceae bacterium]|nr:HNH endonuclease [Ktedonobacteraceae bacterium]
MYQRTNVMKKYLFVLAILAALCILLSGCDVKISGNGSGGPITITTASSGSTTGEPAGSATLGKQTKTSGCVAHGGLPDSACTPGAIFPNATVQQICTPGYASSVRNVPFSEADQVYAEYGIYHHYSGEFEDDHLVPLELGGSNDIANLWPEAANPTPGFHQKDQVENYLHDQVCSGAMSLKGAQTEIATNWIAVYNRMPK